MVKEAKEIIETVTVERVCDLPKEPFWGYEGKSLDKAIEAYLSDSRCTPVRVTAFMRKNGVGIFAFMPVNQQ